MPHRKKDDAVLKDFVECQLCKKKMKRITLSHLVYEHQITMKEYHELFPDAEMTSPLTKKRQGRAMVKRFKKEPISAETKRKISETLKKKFEQYSSGGDDGPKE